MIAGGASADALDASTRGLIARYRALRGQGGE
jgi:hypothetical protein